MSRICDICNKGALKGNKVSHANNKSRKFWQANLQNVRHEESGVVVKIKACTKCIKSGLVIKPKINLSSE